MGVWTDSVMTALADNGRDRSSLVDAIRDVAAGEPAEFGEVWRLIGCSDPAAATKRWADLAEAAAARVRDRLPPALRGLGTFVASKLAGDWEGQVASRLLLRDDIPQLAIYAEDWHAADVGGLPADHPARRVVGSADLLSGQYLLLSRFVPGGDLPAILQFEDCARLTLRLLSEQRQRDESMRYRQSAADEAARQEAAASPAGLQRQINELRAELARAKSAE